MSDRTYGETKNCAGCRYWSEMLAKCEGGGSVQSMCLGRGPYHGKYVFPRMTCSSWESGHFGAIDDPYEDIIGLYDAERTSAEKGKQDG